MPFSIQQSSSGKKWYVISDTGRRLGAHDSKAKATRQLKAVYANYKAK